MNFSLLPPRYQLAETLTRIYQQGLTTVSGGNLSILDENGDLWITPAGVDKGSLSPDDIMCVKADGTIVGRHRPSSEYPFHRMIYQARPDIRALVHAHPSALVAFSIVHKTPDTCITPQSRDICGSVGYAPYAMTGSEELGRSIADTFAQGYLSVLLENHGVVTGGADLLDAFQRFETLEFCAQINLRANAFGGYHSLSEDQIAAFHRSENGLPEFEPGVRSGVELELRLQISQFVRRAYERRLMISTGGTVSARIDGDSFVITPYGFDRKYLQPEDAVLVWDGKREQGKTPSRAVRLHEAIYRAHPTIRCIITSQPPHATIYSLVNRRFDTHTIPESYILLRELPVMEYGLPYQQPEAVAARVSPASPVVLLRNDSVLSTGKSVLDAFDRLEVAEFSAQALLYTLNIGDLVPISEAEIEALKKKFALP